MAPPGIAATDLMELFSVKAASPVTALASPPIEDLMRVHAFGLRYLRYACPRLKSQLHDPALLGNRSVYPLTTPCLQATSMVHEPIVQR